MKKVTKKVAKKTKSVPMNIQKAFTLNEKILRKIKKVQKENGLKSLSETVRFCIESF